MAEKTPVGLLVDTKYCTGCHSCEVACRNEHGFGPDVYGIKLNQVGPFVVDEDKDYFVWDYTPMVSELCDLCGKRVAAGEKPSCVLNCLGACLEYGPIDELLKSMADKGKKCYLMLP
jgi:Fe-S-cluster-containing dehydrogenase component